MTIEQIKAEAKKRFGQELTDEQAKVILESHGSQELSAHVLEKVIGGANLTPLPAFSLDETTISFSLEAPKKNLSEPGTWGVAVRRSEK